MEWSSTWYRPQVHGKESIYIKQIIPYIESVYIAFSSDQEKNTVFFRKKDSNDSWNSIECDGECVMLPSLSEGCEYEFYIASENSLSAVGYARAGYVPGTVVNYLHPEDRKYSFSGGHLCSPSLLVHPDGYLLASMDIYGRNTPQNLTLVFRSDDRGKSWYHYSELFPCFWGTLFYHKGCVYMISVSTEHGDILIGRSDDGGKSFCTPTVLARGSGRTDVAGWHKGAMPITEHAGRLWIGVDFGAHKTGGYASSLLSADAYSDLLCPSSWTLTPPLCFDSSWEGAVLGDERGFLEGNAVVSPDGEILNFLRYSTDRGEPNCCLAGVLLGDVSEPKRALRFKKFVSFPGNLSKFDIKRDESTGYYFTIVSRIHDKTRPRTRNLLSFAASTDLENWTVLCDLIDYRDSDDQLVGFQYVSFDFDGEDILYLCRTAFNGAKSYHDNNYVTFHKIENFRSLIEL